MTIVCVDNTPIMLQSLKENADKAYPYADVQTFLTAEPALNYAEKFGCDVLLCEINPPRLEGLFLAEKVKKYQSKSEYYFRYCLFRERTRKNGHETEAQRIFNQGSNRHTDSGRIAESAVSDLMNNTINNEN